MQIIPHFTDAVQKWIMDAAMIPVTSDGKVPEICIIELVGDIEAAPFVESLRQLQKHTGVESVVNLCCNSKTEVCT